MICSCEIPERGSVQCDRHGVRKTRHMVELCHRGQGGEPTGLEYWTAWEAGTGPGQGQVVAVKPKAIRKLPPLHKQVTSFVTSIARFAADGFRVVDGPEFDRRVAICEACELFIHELGRCSKCGCFGKVKARGKVWTCPEGKWDI